MSLGDFENNKRKVVADNADLLRVVGELSNSLNLLLRHFLGPTGDLFVLI